MPAAINLTGRRFDRLLVEASAGRRAGLLVWQCSCDCGARLIVAAKSLLGGNTRSCGCLKLEALRSRSTRHGHSKRRLRTPTYHSWMAMMMRCRQPSAQNYQRYGGRGITVCERWLSFENFLADMGERPPGMTLDRRDSSLGYEPGNVRWTTAVEQGRHTRRSVLTPDLVQEARGRREHGESASSIARRLAISRSTIQHALKGRTWKEAAQ